jgi:RNA polymerase sigma-70 factor (ECF subfamily)
MVAIALRNEEGRENGKVCDGHESGKVNTLATPQAGESETSAGTEPGVSRRSSNGDTQTCDIHSVIASAQRGCSQSFAHLYDRYVGQVHAYVSHRVRNRATAEDLTADVFMRALRRIGTYRQLDVDFGAWLLTIARNRVNDYFRSASFRLEASVDEIFETPSDDGADDPEAALLSQEAAHAVRTALRQLKGEQAEVLYLRFIEHLDVPQTAAAMSKTVGAVRALQHRALRALARQVPGGATPSEDRG